MPFEPTDELTITLSALEWNQVLGALNEGVYRIVSPIISKITAQCQQQPINSSTEKPNLRAVNKESKRDSVP